MIEQEDTTLRLYAIVRRDLSMPKGKFCAQAGHAFLEAFFKASPDIQQQYRDDPPGTKVTLYADNLEQILWAYEEAIREGLPCSMIVDSGHICPPHFDGSSIVTALGIGPTTKGAVGFITNRFNLS